MEPWAEYLDAFAVALRDLVVTDGAGRALTPADGFRRWLQLTREIHDKARSVYFIGNGGSAMMAGHFAADACKNGGLRALAFNDTSLLTATANDLAFDQIFALPLARLAGSGDLLISTSSSGNSPNILKALDQARSMSLHIVTLSGKGSDNRSRTYGDLNFYVPAQRYGRVECAHQVILHYWLDQYMNLHCDGAI